MAAEEVDDDVALTTELGRWLGGRPLYDPRLPPPAYLDGAPEGQEMVCRPDGCVSPFGLDRKLIIGDRSMPTCRRPLGEPPER